MTTTTRSTATAPPRSPARRPARGGGRAGRWALALIVLGTLVTYVRTLRNDFINFDDPGYVTDVPQVRDGLSPRGVAWAFATNTQANWHPLTWLSHQLDAELFGLHPAGHHATSIVFHTASAALLYLALRRMTGELWPSAFVALLWAVHPQHVESVAWVSERKDVLSTFFAMLTLLAYASYARESSLRAYVLTLVAFTLGLLAKQMLVTLPFALLLLDYWPLKRLASRADVWPRVREKLPLFALSLAASVTVFVAQRMGGAVRDLDERFPLGRRVANAVVSYADYLAKTFWPVDLAAYYPYPTAIPATQVTTALTVLALVTAAALLLARRRPYLIVGWLWFLGSLIPVIGLVQIGAQARADRYTYLPHVGLFVAVVWAAYEAGRRWKVERIVAAAGAVVVVALAVLTWRQIGYWRDSETLFAYTLSVTPPNALAHHQLANEYAREGALDEAEEHYWAALKIRPDHAQSHVNLGNVYARREQYDAAAESYRRAIALAARAQLEHLARAHLGLGLVASRREQFDEAAKHFADALEVEPTLPQAHYQWGLALEAQGSTAEAAAQFEEELRLRPDDRAAFEALLRARSSRPATTRAAT